MNIQTEKLAYCLRQLSRVYYPEHFPEKKPSVSLLYLQKGHSSSYTEYVVLEIGLPRPVVVSIKPSFISYFKLSSGWHPTAFTYNDPHLI